MSEPNEFGGRYARKGSVLVFAIVNAILVTVAGLFALTASAGQPQRTDVMILVDTTGSMSKVLSEASTRTGEVVSRLSAQIPDLHFGLSEVGEAGGSAYDPKNPGAVPWRLKVPITASKDAVVSAVRDLRASGGGDGPEAYGRAIWEAVNNPTVGWRPNAARMIVLIGDSVPHDNDLNEGVPESEWLESGPWVTGTELPEPYGVAGTTIGPQTDLDWQHLLQQLADAGVQLEAIIYDGEGGMLAYWENWASRTGGEAILGEQGDLASNLIRLVQLGAARACATVRGSKAKMLLAGLRCPGALAPLGVVCGAPVGIARSPARFSGMKAGNGRGVPAKLFRAVTKARFLRHGPRGFRTSGQVLKRLGESRTAIKLIGTLPSLSRAVRRNDFERIGRDIAESAGARACAVGLLKAVR